MILLVLQVVASACASPTDPAATEHAREHQSRADVTTGSSAPCPCAHDTLTEAAPGGVTTQIEMQHVNFYVFPGAALRIRSLPGRDASVARQRRCFRRQGFVHDPHLTG